MNRGNQKPKKYEIGEMRIGISSPGIGWVKANGQSLLGYTQLKTILAKAKIYSVLVSQSSNFPSSNNIFAIAYDGNLWVAGGSGGALRTSTDAINWVTRTSNIPGSIYSIAYGNNLWVAAGDSGALRTSTDAVTWVTRTSFFSGAQSTIFAVTYGNGLWVAGGGYGIRTSTDAITWVTQSLPSSSIYIRCIAHNETAWVAGAYTNGTLLTSTDAVTWVTRTSLFGTASGVSAIRAVAYGNGLWVTGGDTGVIRTSTDAITWTTGTDLRIASSDVIFSVAYFNGVWLATTSSGIHISTNALNWNPTQSSSFYNSKADNNGLWALVGANGATATIDPSDAKLPTVYFENNIWGWIKAE